MENCLMCLKINKEFGENIKVNSKLWQEQNIKKIIDKHFWTMETILPSSWICKNCWQELYDFHKFYMVIKETHMNFENQIRNDSDLRRHFDSNEHMNRADSKDLFCSETLLLERNIEPEILIEHPISSEFLAEDQNSFMSQEQEHDLYSDEMPLKQRRKEGRRPKNSSVAESYKQFAIKDGLDAFKNSKKANTSFVCHHDNDDFDRDTKYQDNKKPRKTPQEHDKVIAENFQIFCSLCQTPMENFIALRKHFKVKHKKRGFVICCKRKFFSRPVLVDHIHFHLNPNYFQCKQCGKVLSERSTLEKHMKIHVDDLKERKYTCDLCGKTFKKNGTLENHKLKHSSDYEKKYSCTECGKFFTTVYNLNYHIQAIHHNKFVKICDICGKMIRCRNSFKLHKEKHENKHGTPITCDICGLRLVDRIGLRRHKNSQHSVGSKKEYTCHICSKVFPNLKAFKTHIRFVHEVGYDHKCTMCDKAFKRAAVLRDHMATHTGTVLNTCPWCPKTFVSNGNMYNHRKKDHPREWEELQRQKYGAIIN